MNTFNKDQASVQSWMRPSGHPQVHALRAALEYASQIDDAIPMSLPDPKRTRITSRIVSAHRSSGNWKVGGENSPPPSSPPSTPPLTPAGARAFVKMGMAMWLSVILMLGLVGSAFAASFNMTDKLAITIIDRDEKTFDAILRDNPDADWIDGLVSTKFLKEYSKYQEYGRITPLMVAAVVGNTWPIRKLLDAGVNPTAIASGYTARQLASPDHKRLLMDAERRWNDARNDLSDPVLVVKDGRWVIRATASLASSASVKTLEWKYRIKAPFKGWTGWIKVSGSKGKTTFEAEPSNASLHYKAGDKVGVQVQMNVHKKDGTAFAPWSVAVNLIVPSIPSNKPAASVGQEETIRKNAPPLPPTAQATSGVGGATGPCVAQNIWDEISKNPGIIDKDVILANGVNFRGSRCLSGNHQTILHHIIDMRRNNPDTATRIRWVTNSALGDKAALIDAPNGTQGTPLHRAMYWGVGADVIQALMDAGADATIEHPVKWTVGTGIRGSRYASYGPLQSGNRDALGFLKLATGDGLSAGQFRQIEESGGNWYQTASSATTEAVKEALTPPPPPPPLPPVPVIEAASRIGAGGVINIIRIKLSGAIDENANVIFGNGQGAVSFRKNGKNISSIEFTPSNWDEFQTADVILHWNSGNGFNRLASLNVTAHTVILPRLSGLVSLAVAIPAVGGDKGECDWDATCIIDDPIDPLFYAAGVGYKAHLQSASLPGMYRAAPDDDKKPSAYDIHLACIDQGADGCFGGFIGVCMDDEGKAAGYHPIANSHGGVIKDITGSCEVYTGGPFSIRIVASPPKTDTAS